MTRAYGAKPEAKRTIDRMDRFDTDEDSRIVCSCGASFIWSGFDADLDAFLEKHKECVGGLP